MCPTLDAHRASSFAQDLLGTTAGEILRSGQCPVLVGGEDVGGYASVMVAVDFSPASRRALLIAPAWLSAAHIAVLSAYGKVRRKA